MPAATLKDAANESYAHASIRWTANTLRANFQAYIVACALVVNDATEAVRTVGNWLVPMTALSASMTASSANPLEQELFNDCVDYLYRFNMAASAAQTAGRISASQATALLAAYNANID